jgi:MarR family 2-MHQ and catechol resistance regulon transcriptional repressor
MSGNKYKSDMSGDERVAMAIVRAAERFKKQVSSLLKNYGLSFSQYNVLRVLRAPCPRRIGRRPQYSKISQ